MRETTEAPLTTLKEFKTSAAQMGGIVCAATVAWLLHQEKATVKQSSYEFSPGICPKECGRGPLVEDSLVDDTQIELLCHQMKQCLA